MAEVSPLQALHYDLGQVGQLADVVAPPYDVIDDAERGQLVARSPHNVVELDLPRDPGGGDPYAHAARLLQKWTEDGILTRDSEPTIWALEATGPQGTFRNGVGKENVKVGDRIKARCHLLRDGSPGCLLGFVTPMHGDKARGDGVEHQWD